MYRPRIIAPKSILRRSTATIDMDYFGFSSKKGATHTSRTIMLEELETLLSYVAPLNALKADYFHAVNQENCLRKRSLKTRLLTFRYLADLYLLDCSILLFRALRFFWYRDERGRPLLALLCAYSRDSLLRATAPFILKFDQGSMILPQSLAEYVNSLEPDRFSQATLASTTRNILSTWTKSGHLAGKSRKRRSQAIATPGTVAFALMLGYITKTRGENLFTTEYARLLDCSKEEAIELAREASRRGWIVFKQVGKVIEVLFPNLINPQERERIYEQS